MDDFKPEQIEKEHETFRKLLNQTGDRAPAINKMMDHLGDRVWECPASSRDIFHLSKNWRINKP